MPLVGAEVIGEPLMAGEQVFVSVNLLNRQDSVNEVGGQVTWDQEFIFNRQVTMDPLSNESILVPVTVPDKDRVELEYTGPLGDQVFIDIQQQPADGSLGIVDGPDGVPDEIAVGEEFTANFAVSCPGPSGCNSAQMEFGEGTQNVTFETISQVQGAAAGSVKNVGVTMSFDNTGTKVLQWKLNDTKRVAVIDVTEPDNTAPSVNITNINKGATSIIPDVSYEDAEDNIEEVMWTLKKDGSEIATADMRRPVFDGLQEGSYNLKVKVTDAFGLENSDNSSFDFTPAGQGINPQAEIESITESNGEIKVEGSASDPDGQVTGVTWRLLQNGEALEFGLGESASLPHNGPGDYTVAFVVSDNDGNETRKSATITVEEQPSDGENGEGGMDRNKILAVAAVGAGAIVVSSD